MKLDKAIVQRRLDIMAEEDIVSALWSSGLPPLTFENKTFIPNAHVGVDIDPVRLREENDAVVICTGATWPRDLKIPARDADGIHFAMEFLQVRSRLVARTRTDASFFVAKHQSSPGHRTQKWRLHQCQRQRRHRHRWW